MFKAIIFDGDGTLFHGSSKPQMIMLAMRANGYDVPLSRVKRAFELSRKLTALLRKHGVIRLNDQGYLIENQMRLVLLGLGPDESKRLGSWINRNWSRLLNKKPYPEVKSVLEKIKKRKLKIAILTAGSTESYNKTLKKFGIRRYFDAVVGEDTINAPKPSKRAYLFVLKKLGCSPKQAIFVGDHLINDYVAPSRLGMKAFLLDRKGADKSDAKKIHTLSEVLNKF